LDQPGDTSKILLPETDSQWLVKIHQDLSVESKQAAGLLTAGAGGEIEERADNHPQTEKLPLTDWFREVEARLSWQYPYPQDVRQRAKLSVSEIKKYFSSLIGEEDGIEQIIPNYEQQDLRLLRPKFLQAAAGLTPAEYGTMMHTVMQHLPFSAWGLSWAKITAAEQGQRIREFLAELVRKEILNPDQAETIPTEKIVFFLNSELGRRLLSGQDHTLLREIPFTYNLRQLESRNAILVQGVIDALLLKGRTADLIDYKTDYLAPDIIDPAQSLGERYAMQMALYVQTVEDLLKLKVENCLLYSFALNREFRIPRPVLQEKLVILRHKLRENIPLN
jgi:ATP-dependent helicase/nuclease subunit A